MMLVIGAVVAIQTSLAIQQRIRDDIRREEELRQHRNQYRKRKEETQAEELQRHLEEALDSIANE